MGEMGKSENGRKRARLAFLIPRPAPGAPDASLPERMCSVSASAKRQPGRSLGGKDLRAVEKNERQQAALEFVILLSVGDSTQG
jgi:hypothetical protein